MFSINAFPRLAAWVAFTAAAVVGGTPANAQAPAQAECSFETRNGTFAVTWDVERDSAQYYTVERRAFGRYWWRTRTTLSSFDDSSAPRNAASMAYRVSVRSPDGRVVRRVECSLATSTTEVGCVVTRTESGYEVRSKMGYFDDDFVVRRRVSPNGPMHWRGRTQSPESQRWGVFDDAASPTGSANYQVWTRRGGIISEGYSCAEIDPSLCVNPFAGDFPDNLKTARLGPKLSDERLSELGINPDTISYRQGAYEGGDGLIYYVTAPQVGGEVLNRLDPATGTSEVIEVFEDWTYPSRIVQIDSAGGVYLTQWGGGSRSTQEVSSGVIDPTFRFDFNEVTSGSWAVGNLPDGRTLRVVGKVGPDVVDPFRGFFAYDPVTGISTELPRLHNGGVSSILADGRIVGYLADIGPVILDSIDC